jgi:hypothetical protein
MPFSAFTLVLLFSSFFFVIPSLGADMFMSPDETAVAVSARNLLKTGSFVIQTANDDPLLHPRSFVSVSNGIVPVGFLGMPLLVFLFLRLFGDSGLVLFTPLLTLSVIIPLWSFTRGWGRFAQTTTVLGWMTFPTVILYANRGLFPNLPVVCLALWSSWLLWSGSNRPRVIIAGAIAGLALIIRPIEIIWIFPWLLTASMHGVGRSDDRKTKIQKAAFFFIPLVTLCFVGVFFAWKTYGSPFMVGYQLRDLATNATPSLNDSAKSISSAGWFESWPFGFHPRNVIFNVRSYLVSYLAPWFLIMIAGMIIAWRKKVSLHWTLLGLWTIAVLSLIYGQGLYQDHVRLNQVSLGNSFLRYLLPISVIAAFCLGYVVNWIRKTFQSVGFVLCSICFALVVMFGIWTAFGRDDEGLSQNKIELRRYLTIRQEAERVLSNDAVVLSERSDKIFFPRLRAVSPIPSRERIDSLLKDNTFEVALFIRTLDVAGLKTWANSGFSLQPIMTSANETLYVVTRKL